MSTDLSIGDLVYYDKCGGPYQSVFPFAEEGAIGIGVVISEIKKYEYQGEDIQWTSILDEKGIKQDFVLNYLDLVII